MNTIRNTVLVNPATVGFVFRDGLFVWIEFDRPETKPGATTIGVLAAGVTLGSPVRHTPGKNEEGPYVSRRGPGETIGYLFYSGGSEAPSQQDLGRNLKAIPREGRNSLDTAIALLAMDTQIRERIVPTFDFASFDELIHDLELGIVPNAADELDPTRRDRPKA